jgi:hypothetical protein
MDNGNSKSTSEKVEDLLKGSRPVTFGDTVSLKIDTNNMVFVLDGQSYTGTYEITDTKIIIASEAGKIIIEYEISAENKIVITKVTLSGNVLFSGELTSDEGIDDNKNGGTNETPYTVPQNNVQIEGFFGNAIIKLDLSRLVDDYSEDNSSGDNYIEVGYVNNGKLFLNLPSSIDEAYLIPFTIDFGTINPQNIKFSSYVFILFVDETAKGAIAYGKGNLNNNFIFNDEIDCFYFSKDGEINGTASYGANYEKEEEIHLSVKRGWNWLYYHKISETNSLFTSDLSNVGNGFRWLYVDWN